jgi:hypothetical protein
MLGATDTNSGPEVAPLGIVTMINVLVHESIVMGALFNNTRLPFCEAPKPDPLMVTWLPTEPVVAETLVMAGPGFAVELTDTLSIVTVVSDEVV